MGILRHRQDHILRGRAAAVGMRALVTVPTVILPAGAVRRLEAHFLPLVLAHIGQVKVAGGAVEAEAPHVAQTPRPDLRRAQPAQGERVVRRDAVRALIAIDVNAQNGAKQRPGILGVALRIARRAAIAQRDVQVAVRPEGDHAAVVVGVGLVDAQQFARAGGIGHVRIVPGNRILGHDGRPLVVGVADEQAAVAGIRRVERQTQQSLLGVAADRRDAGREIQERRLPPRAILKDPDAPGLLHHEQAAGAVPGVGHE